MQMRLSSIPAPAIAGVIREKTAEDAIGQIKNCVYGGSDMIDLHMSCLEQDDVKTLGRIIRSCPVPVLALNYNQHYNKENAGLSEEERVASLLRAAEAGAAGIDMQGYTFHAPSQDNFCGEDKFSFTKGNPAEVVTDEKIISKQCELIDRVHHMGAEVLLSCHPGIPMTTQQVVDLALYLQKRGPDIIKIVTKADTEEEGYEAIRTMTVLKREIGIPISYHANGKFGDLSRVINPMLGGQIAFCVEHFDAGSTFGQLPLGIMKNICENFHRFYRG